MNLIDTFDFLMVGKKRVVYTDAKEKKGKGKKEKSPRKKEELEMILVPSLKYRLNKMSTSEKRISLQHGLTENSPNFKRRIKYINKIYKCA